MNRSWHNRRARGYPVRTAALVAAALISAAQISCRRAHKQQPGAGDDAGLANKGPADAMSHTATDATAGETAGETTGETTGARVAAPPVDSIFRPRVTPISPAAKIFLVAASSENANFAQEIIEQRRLWRDAGFADDEIACYYTVPFQEELEADREQFLALAPALARCYPASVKLLFAHLTATADAPFLYLYVTAHGERPISRRLAEAEPGDKGYAALVRKSRYAILDEYRIFFESLPDGTAYGTEVLGAYRAGVDPRTLYFTPEHLAEVLARRAPEQPKFVVLQACYSGGFIADPRSPNATPGLTSVANTTVLTAARFDRESFGCGHDERHTYYGGAFNQALERVLASPLRIDWRALHEAVSARIAELETQLDTLPSEPAFHTSQTR